MSGFLNDLRFGIRQIATKPGFAAAAILTLALGIGANTAVFSFFSGYLLKPLPYPHSNRLVRINVMLRKQSHPLSHVSLPIYRVIKKQMDTLDATAFYTHGTFDFKSGGRARHIIGYYSSASLFHVLGVQPLLGRTFTRDNMHKGSDHVAVISYGMWRNGFGADPNVIGHTIKLDGDIWRIIGVMPRGFAFPDHSAVLWVPYPVIPNELSSDAAFSLHLRVIGRLRPGISIDAARAQIQHAVTTWFYVNAPGHLQTRARSYGFAMGLQPWRQVLVGDQTAILWLLQGAVLLILLMTCANVANLLLSRILGRSHEMAVRGAMGATRARLARQLLVEALCVTVPGGLVGVALAWLVLRFLAGPWFAEGSTIFSVTLDWRVGLFAVGVVFLTAALVSVLPIRHLAKTDLQLVLQEGGRTSSGGRRARRIRSALVITQLTLATGLLAMAGLLLHSFISLQAVDTGFRKDHVLMATVQVPPTDHAGDKALHVFYSNLRARVEAMPGVRQAAISRLLPLGPDDDDFAFGVVGKPLPASGQRHARFNFISPDYFKALGIPLLQGRRLSSRDRGAQTAIIDSGLAAKYFYKADPIGRQLKFRDKKYTIVGVVPSIKFLKLSQSMASVTVYLSGAQYPSRVGRLAIHTSMTPSALIKPLKSLIASIDPNVAAYNVHTMQEQLANSLRHKQTTMTLLLAFGGIALALAIVGVYAVMSYAVGQRRPEFGVRLALGAEPGDLLWLVFKDGLKLLAIGLVVGLGLAVIFGYILSSQLFGVAPFDPLTLIGCAVLLSAITLAACYLPARRAAKLNPAVALQE